MASKHVVQRVWDRIRGKHRHGAVVDWHDAGAIPNHYGARYIYSGKDACRLFQNAVESNRPAFIARPGRTELKIVSEFLNSMHKPRPVFTERWRKNINILSGFFTPTDDMLTRFCCEMVSMFRDIDVFSAFVSMRGEEILSREYLPAGSPVCDFYPIFPFEIEHPWTAALEGKKVLVVHPFTDSIEKQYEKRELLFSNPKTLPRFQLSTLRAVQSSANNPCDFPDWFAALEHMKKQIGARGGGGADFDVALIGAGAYGFFLAHHCKMIGKIGIQMASGVQTLFGIKGRRWTEEWYGGKPAPFINEHWVFPSEDERPANPELVEKGCYW